MIIHARDPELAQVSWLAYLLVLPLIAGCGGDGRKDAAALDSVLTTGGIDRIEFFAGELDKTNVVSGEQVAIMIQLFSATNRTARRPSQFLKYYISGSVFLYSGTNYLGRPLHYLPKYDALWFGSDYFFGLKSTNQLRTFFE